EILPSFDTGKIRADELRSAGLVETASNEQVVEEADASDDTDDEASSTSSTDDEARSSSSTEANAATGGNAATGAKDDDARGQQRGRMVGCARGLRSGRASG